MARSLINLRIVSRWLGRGGPSDTARQIAELRTYLAEELPPAGGGGPDLAAFCLTWIAACAALPLIRWSVTLALGQRLAQAYGVTLNERLHLVIGRLTWFRLGEMQPALRAPLLRLLRRKDRNLVRQVLAEILFVSKRTPLPVLQTREPQDLPAADPAFLQDAALLVERAAPGSAGSDPILGMILRGERPSRWRVRWAQWAARQPQAISWLLRPSRAASLVVLLLVSSGLQFWAVPQATRRLAFDEAIPTTRYGYEVSLGGCLLPDPKRSWSLSPYATGPDSFSGTVGAGPFPTRVPLNARFSTRLIGTDLRPSHPEESRIATLSDDGTVRIWQVATGRLITTLEADHQFFNTTSTYFGPDGQHLFAKDSYHNEIWDTSTGKLTARLPAAFTISAAFSPDGLRVVTANEGNTANVWEVTSGKLVAALKGHTAPVYDATFSHDGGRVVTASADGTVRIWDVATGLELSQFRVAGSPVYAVFGPDKKVLLVDSDTDSEDRNLSVWRLADGEKLFDFPHKGFEKFAFPRPGPGLRPAFSADSRRIVIVNFDKLGPAATILDASTGAKLLSIEGKGDLVTAAIFDSDGSRVIMSSYDMTVLVSDARTGGLISTFDGTRNLLQSAKFSLDGRRLITVNSGGIAQIWDRPTGRQLAVLSDFTGALTTAAFSADDTRIVTGSSDGTGYIWDAATGRKLATLSGHTKTVNAAAFSADGRRVVTGSDDETARIWDSATGAAISPPFEMSSGVESVVFSNDGSRIFTKTRDGIGITWITNTSERRSVDIAMGLEVASLLRFMNDANYVFTPDEKFVVIETPKMQSMIVESATGHLVENVVDIFHFLLPPNGRILGFDGKLSQIYQDDRQKRGVVFNPARAGTSFGGVGWTSGSAEETGEWQPVVVSCQEPIGKAGPTAINDLIESVRAEIVAASRESDQAKVAGLETELGHILLEEGRNQSGNRRFLDQAVTAFETAARIYAHVNNQRGLAQAKLNEANVLLEIASRGADSEILKEAAADLATAISAYRQLGDNELGAKTATQLQNVRQQISNSKK